MIFNNDCQNVWFWNSYPALPLSGDLCERHLSRSSRPDMSLRTGERLWGEVRMGDRLVREDLGPGEARRPGRLSGDEDGWKDEARLLSRGGLRPWVRSCNHIWSPRSLLLCWSGERPLQWSFPLSALSLPGWCLQWNIVKFSRYLIYGSYSIRM